MTNDTKGKLEDETHLLYIFELKLQLQMKNSKKAVRDKEEEQAQGVGTSTKSTVALLFIVLSVPGARIFIGAQSWRDRS